MACMPLSWADERKMGVGSNDWNACRFIYGTPAGSFASIL